MNNRPIKLRAWDKKEKELFLIDDLYWFEENYVHSFDDDRYVFQQYTGLTDSTGKEIYEGDIVLRRGKGKEVRLGEFWDGVDIGNGFFLQTSDRKLSYRNFGTNKISSFNESKVIGNIFQNPELLHK